MNSNKKFIPALGYNWLSGFYDLTIKLTMPENKFRTLLIEELDPQDNEKILEFGFGTGQNLILVHQNYKKVLLSGVDIDPEIKSIALVKLEKLGFNIPLDLYDGKTLPYNNNSFDKVFSSLVFHQLDKETKLSALKEIYRILKPGGQLIIGDWGKAETKMMRFAFYAVQLLDGFKTTEDNVRGLLPELIKQVGFIKVIQTRFINTKLGTFSYYKGTKY